MTSLDDAKEIKIYKALVEPSRISLCLSNMSEFLNVVALNLPDVFSFIDFQIILWSQTSNDIFKIETIVNNCGYCLVVHKLLAQKDAIKCQKIIQLKNSIYLLALLAFAKIRRCYNHLKLFSHCLNITFYPNDNVFKTRIGKIQEKKKELVHFFSITKARKYFNKFTLLSQFYLAYEVIERDRYLSFL